MKYFEMIPNIIYGNRQIVNLFYKYDFIKEINIEYLFNHEMQMGECLEDVSLKYYKTTELWWILAMINNIQDVFYDILLSDELIRDMARKQSTVDEILDQELFIEKYEFLSDENEKKRIIKILNEENVTDFLSAISRISERNTFIDTLTSDLEYVKLDTDVYNNFMNSSKLIDKEGNMLK